MSKILFVKPQADEYINVFKENIKNVWRKNKFDKLKGIHL